MDFEVGFVMVQFNIISLEDFDSVYGYMKKGDIINTIDKENIRKAKKWAYEQYGPYGENIKHKVMRC